MPAQVQLVSEFQGLWAGRRRPLHTDRRPLNTPRDITNMLPDDNNHLWMPPAPDGVEANIGVGHISQIVWSVIGGFFAQQGNKLYASDRDPSEADNFTWHEIISDLYSDETVWVTSFGYAEPNVTPRVYVGNTSHTWRIEATGANTWDVTDLTSQLDGFHGWASFQHLGRRWVARDSQLIYFSGINQPESFTEEEFINVGGGSIGSDASTFPGEVTGFFLWETNLGIMCAGSMWVLSGTTLDTFHLRRLPHQIGSQGRTTAHYSDIGQGMAFLGGERDGAMGVYVFRGSRPQKISQPIDEFFQSWQLEYDTVPADPEPYIRVREALGQYAIAARYRNYYILSFSPADDQRQVYILNIDTQKWTTFTGWGSEGPAVAVVHDYYHPQRLLIGTDDGDIHEATTAFPRRPGETASFVLGWSDQDRPLSLQRFLGVKIHGWHVGSGTPKITVGAETDNAGTASRGPFDLPTQVFDGFVVPINVRGAAIELTVTITPTADDDEVLIEGLELITSRKGEKMSRQ
jgi:hypothetical protein